VGVLGIRLVVRGRRPVVLGLSEEMPLVSAGASLDSGWGRRGGPMSLFTGTGIDDRQDHVRWAWVEGPRAGAWIDMQVVEVTAGDVPVPRRRRRMDWRAFFARMARRDERRLRALEGRLARVRSGAPYVVPLKEPGPPARGLRVTLNGKVVGRIGVRNPGSLSVVVVGRRREAPGRFRLRIHGGERLGRRAWRWYEWPWNGRVLEVGDRVHIEVIAPRRLTRARVREVSVSEPRTETEIRDEIARLQKRARPWWYENEATSMQHEEALRPAPRLYAGGRVVR
jgi:hypothetical protein